MTAMGVILICIAVLAVLVLICAVSLWWNRSGENKAYDERQLVEQGRARVVAGTVGEIYFFLLMVLLFDENSWLTQRIPLYLVIFIGLMIQSMVYHIYCVMTHALLPFGKSPVLTISTSVLMSLIQFGYYAMDYQMERHIPGVLDQDSLLHLILGVVFAFYALIHLIALLRKERE